MSDIETTENNKNNFLPGQGSNPQEAAQRLQDIGSSILRAARDELYLGMRFLDVALSSFIYQMDGSVSPFGTDGAVMYFHPAQLGGLYKENRILVNRGYLHMVFHCISGTLEAGNREAFVEFKLRYCSGAYDRRDLPPLSPIFQKSSPEGNLPSSGKGKEDAECRENLQDSERRISEGKRTGTA